MSGLRFRIGAVGALVALFAYLSVANFVPEERQARGFVTAREEGVLSGNEVAAQVFRELVIGARALAEGGGGER